MKKYIKTASVLSLGLLLVACGAENKETKNANIKENVAVNENVANTNTNGKENATITDTKDTSQGEESTVFAMEQSGIKVEVIYTHNGDIITKQTTKTVTPFSLLGATNADDAKRIFEALPEQSNEIPGVTQKTEYSDTDVTQIYEIDLSKVNLEDAQSIEGLNLMDSNSFELVKQAMEAGGYKIQE